MEIMFSIESWWRWLIFFVVVIFFVVIITKLAKELFSKQNVSENKHSIERTENPSILSSSKYRGDNIDMGNFDSGTNITNASNIINMTSL